MPRPSHYRDREKAASGSNGVDAPKPRPAPGETSGNTMESRRDNPSATSGVDGEEPTRQPSLRSGSILPEGLERDAARNIARRLGWVPQEEWKRDSAKWRDEFDFLEDQPQRFESLKSRYRAVSATAEQQLADERAQIRAEAEREIREAAEAQDPDKAVAASAKLAKVSGPLPETQAWMGRNTWFNSDPVAQAAAVAEINRRVGLKESVQDQLDGAEALIRKRFPEHFGSSEPPERREDREPRREEPRGGERRLADIPRREPPFAAEGQRGGGSRRDREQGWGDMPAGDRAALAPFVKRMKGRGVAEAQAQENLARSYWENKAG